MFVLGSLNVDLVARVPRLPGPGETVQSDGLRRLAGGKGANQAVAARAAGVDVVMVGCVGDDEAGSAYLARLFGLGIMTAHVRVVAGESTGQAFVTVDDNAENAIVVVPGANSRVDQREVAVLAEMTADDVLLTQLEVPPDQVVDAAQLAVSRGARVVVNLAPYAALPQGTLDIADPVVVNEHEASLLADSGRLPRSLLVTFGAAGAAWDGDQLTGPSVAKEQVVDTTGAGDAFCGALAAALARRSRRMTALRAALGAGARAVRHEGAQPHPDL